MTTTIPETPPAGRALASAASTRARSCAARRSSSGDMRRPADAAREGAAQPGRARAHRLHRHLGRGGDARGRLRAHRRRPRATSTRTTGTRSRTGRSSPSTRCASTASRSRPWPPRRLRPRRPASRRSRSSTRSCRWSRTLRRGARRGAPLVNEADAEPGPLPRPRRARRPRDGNVCYRYRHRPRRARSGLRARGHRRRGRVHLPGRLPVRDGDAHRRSPRSRATRSPLWATCQHPFLVRAEIADLFGVPRGERAHQSCRTSAAASARSRTRRWSRSRSRSRARPGGRCGSRTASSESMVTTRRHNMRCRMRTAATAEGRLLARDVECSFDTGAYADNGPRVTATGGDAAPGPYRWAAYPGRRRLRLHEHRALGLVPGVRRHAPAVDRRVAGRRGRPPGGHSTRSRSAAATCCTRARRSAPGGKPLDADLIGDVEKVAAAVGWDEAKPPRRRPRPLGRAARRRRASGLERRLPPGGGRRVVVLVGTTEMGQGPRTAFAQIAAEEIGVEPERVTVRGADTRFTPYDRSTGASRSTTLAGLAVQRAAADIRAQLDRDRRARADIDPLRPSSRSCARHFGFAGGELIGRGEVAPRSAPARTPRARSSGRSASAPPRSRSTRTPGFVRVLRTATAADVGRAINPQLVERQDEGATLQGIGNALFEEMVYEDGLLLNDTLLDYRVPSFEDLPGRDDLRHRRERRRARARTARRAAARARSPRSRPRS